MNNQEAFNIMVQHLRKQGRKSVLLDDHNSCAYRGADGLKCAIGALLSDNEYKAEFEGKPVNFLLDYGLLRNLDNGLLMEMQNVHDFAPVHRWEDRFQDMAEEYSLTLPEDKR
jgi:hypothetical protein